MKLNITGWIIIALILLNAGQFIYMKIYVQDNTELKLEHKEELKKAEQKARDNAFLEIEDDFQEARDSIEFFKNQNSKIKYIPYEKPIYIDRNLDTARAVMSRARRLLRSQEK